MNDGTLAKNQQRPAKRRLPVEIKQEVPPYLVVPDDLPAYREVPGDDNWEVEEIIDYKYDTTNGDMYLVKWRGYKEPEWKQKQYLDKCDAAIGLYFERENEKREYIESGQMQTDIKNHIEKELAGYRLKSLQKIEGTGYFKVTVVEENV